MFKLVLSASVLLLQFWSAYGSSFRPDYKFSKLAKGWLKLHQVPATFNEAMLRCDAEGTVLASPYDEGIHIAIKELFADKITCAMYTGIHATISKGDYTTVEGIPIERIPAEWAPDEPIGRSIEEGCVVMLPDGFLASVNCTEAYPYICYRKKTHSIHQNECGTTDDEYKLNKQTGSCYKFHQHAKSWRQAYSQCYAEGGYLAIIDDAQEVEVLKDIFNKNYRETAKNYVSLTTADEVFIGMRQWGDEPQWYTIHGKRIESPIPYNWAGGQPDNSTSRDLHGERCGTMLNRGVVNDVSCDWVYLRFICEKEPEDVEETYVTDSA